MKFTSIGHLINKDLLYECQAKMEARKAAGIDGITKEDYEKNLSENITQLVERLKDHSYKPKPARRVEIPKDNDKTRPLSIYCYEDKLVQEALREILEAIFEPLFPDSMMGFRPHRGCHDALRRLDHMIGGNKTGWVVDADIKGYFDNLDHKRIIEFVQRKITDPNILRLVRRMLKSGIIRDFRFEATELGSGQGSVCSPVIANIYMYYVIARWLEEEVKPSCKGYAEIVIYADDFVACFQYRNEARAFFDALRNRLKCFGLELQEEKSRLIRFGRFAARDCLYWHEGTKPETFDFLGFTHYCSKSRNAKFRVKRKTSKKKFAKKCKEMNKLIKNMRNLDIADIIASLNQILVGYYHYYGITDNSKCINSFYQEVRRILFYWLNRRSQKKSYTWSGFCELLKAYPLATPKIYVCISSYAASI